MEWIIAEHPLFSGAVLFLSLYLAYVMFRMRNQREEILERIRMQDERIWLLEGRMQRLQVMCTSSEVIETKDVVVHEADDSAGDRSDR
jgi:hypothetical protein